MAIAAKVASRRVGSGVTFAGVSEAKEDDGFETVAPEESSTLDPRLSAPARLKKQRTDLSMLTKEQRLAQRKASMTAGDSWEDLHGTKDRPGKEVSAARARQLSNLAAAHGDEDPHVAAAVDWSSPANGAAPSSEAAGSSSDSKNDTPPPPPPPPPPPDDDRMTTVPVQRRNLQTLLASRKDDNEETKFRV